MEELKSLLPEYCKRLQKKGVTREALHREYLSSHPDGYGRTRFYILIQQHIACSRPIMYLEHKAGDKVFIDFAGDKLSIIDLDTGEIIPVEVFVAILPCSQLTYVEAVMSQKKDEARLLIARPIIGPPLSTFTSPAGTPPAASNRTATGVPKRTSISDWKTQYLDICRECAEQSECCGLFATSRCDAQQVSATVPTCHTAFAVPYTPRKRSLMR